MWCGEGDLNPQPTRGICKLLISRPTLNGFEQPVTIRSLRTQADSSRGDQFGPGLGGSGGEHRIKAGSIHVPAAAIGIVKKVLVAGRRRFPRCLDSVGLQGIALQEPFPDAQSG